MASPESITMKNFSGKYYMNKEISSKFDPVLAAQGVSWAIRTIASYANPVVVHEHYVDANGNEALNMITPGVKGLSSEFKEEYILDDEEREKFNPLFGKMIGRATRSSESTIRDISPFLLEGWLPDVEDSPATNGYFHVYAEGDTSKGAYEWRSDQVWGFQEVEVDGKKEKYFCKKTYFDSPSLKTDITMYYSCEP